jgi:hypothetical protein
MFDNVQRGRLLVKPARKHLAPFIVCAVNNHLDKCAGEPILLPGCRCLARFQPHHDIPDAHRLARFHHQFAGKPVALVEQAKRRYALRHRGCRCQRRAHGRFMNHWRSRSWGWTRDRGHRILDGRGRLPGDQASQRNTAARDHTAIHDASGLHAS